MKSQEPFPLASTAATLDRLQPGEAATVLAVTGADLLAQRLQDHGLWPGAHVRVLRCAPFGDPMLCLLHGMRLALRKEEAIRVQVLLEVAP